MINFETLLISGNNHIYILSIPKEEEENRRQDCEIF